MNDSLDDFLSEAFAALPRPEPSDALRERLRQRTQIRPLRYIAVIEERRGGEYRIVRRDESVRLIEGAKEAEIAPYRPNTTTYFYCREEKR